MAATGTTPRDGGEEIASRGLGPFVTERTIRFADGTITRWDSRRERKRARTDTESTWWAPLALGWWIAVLFAVGATCFTVAAVPSLAAAVGTRTDNLVYFVGSLFFTSAGLLLYAQVAGVDDPRVAGTGRRARMLLVPRPRRIDWLAAVVQSAGTLFFNVSTGHALWATYTTTAGANRGVWRPDAFGSTCFLVSSYLSYAEVCHGGARWEPTSLPWWITVGNLVGSVAFGVSAVASKLEPSGDLRSGTWTTAGTFVGGLCFLGASILLLPERTAARAAPPPTPPPTGT
ncbi:MAG TPA: hypothetical protein VND44_08575 [Acidimicrobiales bacterium]|nr:hypothetical protein [Acidimicrobiales bacterium]